MIRTQDAESSAARCDSSPGHRDTVEGPHRATAPQARPSRPVWQDVAALGLFFASGAAGLIYEGSWSRQIGLRLGQTAHAAAFVLGSYFAGLAIGNALAPRIVRRVSPLAGYALAELVVALWACMIPVLLGWAESPAVLGPLNDLASGWQTAAQAAFCCLVLLPATAALGATWPLMAEFVTSAPRRSGTRLGIAYALNTSGALLGSLSATGFLLVSVGVRASGYCAAGLSAGCGVVAWMLVRTCRGDRFDEQDRPAAPKASPCGGLPERSLWAGLAAVSGFGMLALEILYLRLFALVFHNSTYTFGVVVAVFLLGLACGSALAALLLRRCNAERLLPVAGATGSAAVVASLFVFVQITDLEYFTWGASFAAYLAGGLALVVLIVLPPVALLGMILPILWAAAAKSGAGTGTVVGRLTALNTLAAACGALSTGWFVLPVMGLWSAFALLVLIFAAIPGGLLWRQRRTGAALASGTIAAGLAMLLVVGLPRMPRSGPDAKNELVRRWESAYGWIDVVRTPDGSAWQIRQNLHYGLGSTGAGAVRARRQAHLPLLLHPHPRDVLFLGLGTGLSPGAALAHPDVRHEVVVELIPQVVEAARLLAPFNGGVVDHPRVTLHVDDARHYLRATSEQFDVVVSDLFVPWESGAGSLYTVEHYRRVRDRLKPGGLCCQWLPLYQMGPDELELIADSFAAAFSETTLWWGQMDGNRPILALVGGDRPLTVGGPDLKRRFAAVEPLAGGSDIYLAAPTHVWDLYLGRWSCRAPDRLNTDEHPRVEFLAPQSHRDSRLLQGAVLREYFDRVLARLPADGVQFRLSRADGAADRQHRRAWQRLLLFGEPQHTMNSEN